MMKRLKSFLTPPKKTTQTAPKNQESANWNWLADLSQCSDQNAADIMIDVFLQNSAKNRRKILDTVQINIPTSEEAKQDELGKAATFLQAGLKGVWQTKWTSMQQDVSAENS